MSKVVYAHSSLEFYGQIDHRRRRWMRKVKMQQSEMKLYKKLDSLRTDDRPLLLAYGSWGLTTSRRFKGLPPCIGVGLLRKISKRFLVVPTPEHYTSKTCAVCFHECGAHPTLKRMVKKRREDGSVEVKEKEIRGLRVCQNECCKLFMNRDKMGSINIATNFERLAAGKSPIRHLSNEEEELNQLQCSLCSE